MSNEAHGIPTFKNAVLYCSSEMIISPSQRVQLKMPYFLQAYIVDQDADKRNSN